MSLLETAAQPAVAGRVSFKLLLLKHFRRGDKIPEHTQVFPVKDVPHLRQTILMRPCPLGTLSVVLHEGQTKNL